MAYSCGSCDGAMADGLTKIRKLERATKKLERARNCQREVETGAIQTTYPRMDRVIP